MNTFDVQSEIPSGVKLGVGLHRNESTFENLYFNANISEVGGN